MTLVIGGYAQGKLGYVLSRTKAAADGVTDGESCGIGDPPAFTVVVDKLHLLIRRLMRENADPKAFIWKIIDANPDVTLICDEVGCGVIPLDGFDREWRETVGRICCELAAKSTRVERVFAGIPTVIKGD